MTWITLNLAGEVKPSVLEELKPRLAKVFSRPVESKRGMAELKQGFDPVRKQYLSAVLLSSLDSLGVRKGEKVLGVTWDTDQKQAAFCPLCGKKLDTKLSITRRGK